MRKYNLYQKGSVDDVKCSLRHVEAEITIKELQHEIDLEMRFKGRATVVNMLNAAINRKHEKIHTKRR